MQVGDAAGGLFGLAPVGSPSLTGPRGGAGASQAASIDMLLEEVHAGDRLSGAAAREETCRRCAAFCTSELVHPDVLNRLARRRCR